MGWKSAFALSRGISIGNMKIKCQPSIEKYCGINKAICI